jgi:hypothetical protein
VSRTGTRTKILPAIGANGMPNAARNESVNAAASITANPTATSSDGSPSSHCANADYRVKLIATVMSTGTGTPFRRVGVYSHCRTASSAA